MIKLTSPVVVLVRPQLGENIGAVARAMNNFGLGELRLVAPRDGWDKVKMRAREVASGAEAIIDAAKLYQSTEAALADIHLAYATSARLRDIEKRVVDPETGMKEIRALSNPHPNLLPKREKELASPSPSQGEGRGEGRRVALLFGPERTGLENDDAALADAFITIPTSPDHFSLNLAQAMVIIGYEWFRQNNVPILRDLPDPAPKKEWTEMFDQLEAYLDGINYFRVASKKPLMWQNLKNMLLRGAWSEQELRTFRGVLRLLYEKPRVK